MNTRWSTSHLAGRSLPAEIDGYDSLAELALDMRWSWNHATDQVWQQLDPVLWDGTHKPWIVLQTVSRDQIKRVLAGPAGVARICGPFGIMSGPGGPNGLEQTGG